MMKLTMAQINDISRAAYEIQKLETAKDRLKPQIARFDVGDHRGEDIEVEVPVKAAHEEIARRLVVAHRTLNALGVELVPGG